MNKHVGPSEPEGRGAIATPDFCRTVNPIPTMEADYAQHISTCPLGFSDLPLPPQQHQHQLQLARPALFIFSFRPKNLAEVIVRHC